MLHEAIIGNQLDCDQCADELVSHKKPAGMPEPLWDRSKPKLRVCTLLCKSGLMEACISATKPGRLSLKIFWSGIG